MAQLIRAIGLGGMDEIGASAILVEVIDDLGNRRSILVDSGIRMENKNVGGRIVKTSSPHAMPDEKVDAMLVSHAHSDHAGNVPSTVAKNPEAIVYMTRPTLYIAGVLWRNSLYLMKEGQVEVPLSYQAAFGEAAVKIATGENAVLVEKPGWTNIFPGVDAYFHPNGHIRGSACIILRVGNRYIFFSGDMSVYDTPTVKGMKMPEEFVGKIDAAFVEATYGDRILIPREDEEERMARLAKETMARGGSCLWPAFGVGRSPDAFLAQIIRGVDPVFLDGLGVKILEIYASEHGSWCDLDHTSGVDLRNHPDLKIVYSRDERNDIIYGHRPFSVVTTAGMMIEGSCAMQYARRNGFLSNPKNLLGFTGFLAENTEGKEIEESVEHNRLVMIGGRPMMIRAQVPPRLQLSSHADGMQVAEIVNRLAPKKVFINHGHVKGRDGLEANLRKAGFGGGIFKPRNGDIITF